MKVKLIEDYGPMPSGSVIEVTKQTKRLYTGMWSSMNGTYLISVLKSKCIIISND